MSHSGHCRPFSSGHCSISSILTLVCAVILSCAAASCSKDSASEDTYEADYTVMIYGCAGGTLDAEGKNMLEQCLAYGSTKSVKVAVEYNFSKQYQDCSPLPGTLRVSVPEDIHKYVGEDYDTKPVEHFISWMDSVKVAQVLKNSDGSPLDLSSSKNLTEFIDWAAGEYPAKNYILVLWNHGKAWMYEDDGTKAILFDDNFQGKSLSLNALEEAVKNSAVKRFKCLYTDACLMCNIENYFGYRQFADYALGSTSPAAQLGGDYTMLLTLLNGIREKKDANLSASLKSYCNYLVSRWDYSSNRCFDSSLTDLSKLDSIAYYTKNFVDTLVKAYPSDKDAINEGIKSALAIYKNERGQYYPLIDLYDLIGSICAKTNYPSLTFMWFDVGTAIDKAKYTACTSAIRNIKQSNATVSFSVNLMEKSVFAAAKESYAATDFDSLVGWSRFLEINEQALDGNPCMVNALVK